MSAGVRPAGWLAGWLAVRPKAVHRPEFKRYRSEFFGEPPKIYVDVHLG